MTIPRSLNSITPYGTAFTSVHSIEALAHQLFFCSQEQFTGQVDLNLQMSSLTQWSLYFERGQLVWGIGGLQPIRSLHRHLSPYYFIPVNSSVSLKEGESEYWTYHFVVSLLEQNRIQIENVKQIVHNLIVELLFDLFQQWDQKGSKLQMHFKHTRLDSANLAPFAVLVREIWWQATSDWQAWRQADLAHCMPNQAPIIWDAKGLQQQVLSSTYHNLVTLMDGQRTLRELAVRSNNNLLVMTQSLLPYINKGLIKLLDVQDWQPLMQSKPIAPLPASGAVTAKAAQVQSEQPLIACIDDHKDDGQLMDRILTGMGYRFIHIQDSMQALPILLECKPSLIFLDLVMPIVTGYEACAQIRRISKLKDTPVIILTSNDGIIDRVRAKMVGSTGFLSKPIDAKKIEAVLQKTLLIEEAV